MKRRIVAFLLVVILFIVCCETADAYSGAGEHWQDIRYVLFGDKFFRGKDQNVVHKRQALEYAAQVCIDQFSNSHTTMLELLHKRLPRLSSIDIASINLNASATTHRPYTHLGWDHPYESDKLNENWKDAKWPMRQEIMLATVEDIFNFNGLPGFIDPLVGYDARCESFCKLIYYIHILGDHIAYSNTSYEKGKNQVMPLAGTRGKYIISEIINLLPILFPNQKYSEFENELNSINSQLVSVLNEPDKLTTPNGFSKYHNLALEVRETLHKYIPNMLKSEDFFNSVFY